MLSLKKFHQDNTSELQTRKYYATSPKQYRKICLEQMAYSGYHMAAFLLIAALFTWVAHDGEGTLFAFYVFGFFLVLGAVWSIVELVGEYKDLAHASERVSENAVKRAIAAAKRSDKPDKE